MFFLLLALYPAIEIAVFVLVAKALGSWASAIFLALATSFIGLTLLRMRRAEDDFSQGRPGRRRTLEDYLFGNLGCFLLVLPGFVSDVLGLALLSATGRKALLAIARFLRIGTLERFGGPFSVLRAYSFGDSFAPPRGFGGKDGPFDAPDDFAASDDDPIDVEPISSGAATDSTSKASSNPTDEPIDVEFTVRK